MTAHHDFVGRAEERRRITRLLAHPDRRVVLLTGPAGIGKTRLAREAATAAPGTTVHWAQADPAGRDMPFGVFEKWADPALTDPLPRFAELLARFSRTNGCLLVVDDVHLADDFSLFLIHQLVTDTPARVILTLRSGEPIPRAVGEILRLDRVERIELGEFTLAEVTEFLTVRGRPPTDERAAGLWRRSGGNPLFLNALVDATDDAPYPDDLRTAVESMLRRHTYDGLGLLIDVLSEAESLPLATLTGLTGTPAVEAAETRGVITIAPGGAWITRLAHPLYGEVHRATLSAQTRRELRLRILDEANDDPHPHDDYGGALRLARLAAETPGATNRDVLLLNGAEGALSVLDMPLAAELSGHVAPGSPHYVRARILYGYAQAAVGDEAGSERAFGGIESIEVVDPALRETIGLIRAGGNMWAGDDPEPLRRLAEDPSTSAETRDANLAFIAALHGHPRLSLRRQPADPPRPAQRTPVDGRGVNGLVAAAARIIATGEVGDHRALLAAIDAGFGQLETSVMATSQQTQLCTFMALALNLSGDVSAAGAALERMAMRLSPFPGVSQHFLTGLRGITARTAGDVRAAGEFSAGALDGFAATGMPLFVRYPFHLARADAAAQSGDLRVARRELSYLAENPHRGHQRLDIRLALCRAWCLTGRRPIDDAIGAVLAAADAAHERGRHGLEVVAVQTALRLGATSLAARSAALLAAAPEMPRARTTGRHALALADDDPDALLALATDNEHAGDRMIAADAAAQAASSFMRHGRGYDAVDALALADRIATEIGLTSPALRAADRDVGLSERQRGIIHRARQGAPSRVIAEELSVSVRTVEGHLYRASRLLGGPVRAGTIPSLRPRHGE
ncbi:AAA family ATPase [Gordonia sp. FQ]|uniref:AAA family ATPase n=1 Tax=Gordonia sp. FQ TaxID=3446634 RepID=UPI003F85A73F